MSRISLTTLLVLMLMVSSKGRALESRAQDRSHNSGQDYSRNERRTQPCEPTAYGITGLLAVNDSASVQSGGNAKNDSGHELEQRQTEAEESMSRGTWSGSTAAWVGSIFTGISIALLIWTLSATRKMNRIMEETHISERRPWVSIELSIGKFINCLVENTDGYMLEVKCVAKNHGATPALNVMFFPKITVPKLGDSQYIERLFREAGDEFRKREDRTAEVIFPDQEGQFNQPVAITRKEMLEGAHPDLGIANIVLYGVLQYRSPNGRTKHQTSFLYFVGEIMRIGPIESLHGPSSVRVDADWTVKEVGLVKPGRIEAD